MAINVSRYLSDRNAEQEKLEQWLAKVNIFSEIIGQTDKQRDLASAKIFAKK